jgi:hypothetical protein
MSYEFQRRLKFWGRFFDDPQAKAPVQMSQAPVQAAGILNAPASDTVFAWTVDNVLGPKTLVFNFDDNRTPGHLRGDRIWQIIQANMLVTDAGGNYTEAGYETKPFRDETGTGKMGFWSGYPIDRNLVGTAGNFPVPSSLVGHILPWGAEIRYQTLGLSVGATVVTMALGYLRGSLVNPICGMHSTL